MKLLAELSEGSLGLSEQFEHLGERYRLRKSARAILKNEKGEIAVQYLQNYSFHKLPGGGVEEGETVEGALLREVAEEVGCDSIIERPVGLVIEYRNKYKLLHLSYCYAATVKGSIGTPKLEKGEIEEGQITLWLAPEEVFRRMKSDVPGKFEGQFILEREMAFLKEYIETEKGL